jgi:nitroreductase
MTTAVADALRARRTIHDFVPGSAPPAAVLEAAIAHAVLAPNHHLTRPWRFYLPGPETVEAICTLNAAQVRSARGEAAAASKLKRWRAMPGWMVLTCAHCAEPVRQREDFAACCCAAQNFSLYLWEQGYGVKWTTGEVTRSREFARLLGIDAEREDVVGLFWCGRPARVPERAAGGVPLPLSRTP